MLETRHEFDFDNTNFTGLEGIISTQQASSRDSESTPSPEELPIQDQAPHELMQLGRAAARAAGTELCFSTPECTDASALNNEALSSEYKARLVAGKGLKLTGIVKQLGLADTLDLVGRIQRRMALYQHAMGNFGTEENPIIPMTREDIVRVTELQGTATAFSYLGGCNWFGQKLNSRTKFLTEDWLEQVRNEYGEIFLDDTLYKQSEWEEVRDGFVALWGELLNPYLEGRHLRYAFIAAYKLPPAERLQALRQYLCAELREEKLPVRALRAITARQSLGEQALVDLSDPEKQELVVDMLQQRLGKNSQDFVREAAIARQQILQAMERPVEDEIVVDASADPLRELFDEKNELSMQFYDAVMKLIRSRDEIDDQYIEDNIYRWVKKGIDFQETKRRVIGEQRAIFETHISTHEPWVRADQRSRLQNAVQAAKRVAFDSEQDLSPKLNSNDTDDVWLTDNAA